MDVDEEFGEVTVGHRGFFPLVIGDCVRVRQAGAMAIASKGDVDLRQGGAQIMWVKGDLSIRQGGANSIVSGGDVSVREGGVVFAAARSVHAQNSWVGVALGRDVDVTGSRVLVGPVQALTFGAVTGLVLALMGRLFGRSCRC